MHLPDDTNNAWLCLSRRGQEASVTGNKVTAGYLSLPIPVHHKGSQTHHITLIPIYQLFQEAISKRFVPVSLPCVTAPTERPQAQLHQGNGAIKPGCRMPKSPTDSPSRCQEVPSSGTSVGRAALPSHRSLPPLPSLPICPLV